MLLSEIVNDHYLPAKRAKLRASTVAGYESSIALYVLPRWGSCDVTEINPDDVQAWVDSIDLAGAAEKAYKCLRQIVRFAIRKMRLRIADPTLYIELPAKTQYLPDVLDSDGVADLLRGMWGHWAEAVTICAVTLGLRRGEACGLEWSDINLSTGEVRIRRSRQYVEGEIVTVGTKTKKSTRSCYLPRFARERLRQIKGCGLLTGNVSPDKVARAIKSWCKRQHLPHVSMTNMRHTWATLAVEAGVGIEIIAMMLGHSEISTAYDHYIVSRKSILVEAQTSVEGLLFKHAKRPRKVSMAT